MLIEKTFLETKVIPLNEVFPNGLTWCFAARIWRSSISFCYYAIFISTGSNGLAYIIITTSNPLERVRASLAATTDNN